MNTLNFFTTIFLVVLVAGAYNILKAHDERLDRIDTAVGITSKIEHKSK
jgi:hypothetical protein